MGKILTKPEMGHTILSIVWALLLCVVLPSISAAKQCLIPWTLEVKRANGTLEHVIDVPVSYQSLMASVDLAPGDSLVLDMQPNNYCFPYEVVTTVRQGSSWQDQGPVLAMLGGVPPYRHTFRFTGALWFDIEGIGPISGTASIHVFEVGGDQTGTNMPEIPEEAASSFHPSVQQDLLWLGSNPAGTLHVFDVAGRTVLSTTVPQDAPAISLHGWASGAFTVVLQYEAGCLHQRVVVGW